MQCNLSMMGNEQLVWWSFQGSTSLKALALGNNPIAVAEHDVVPDELRLH